MNFDRLRGAVTGTADTARDRATLAATGNRGIGAIGGLAIGAVGAGLGAAAAFLLDPNRGRARRAQLLDQGAAAVRKGQRTIEGVAQKLGSEANARISALKAERSLSTAPVDDVTLNDRVRSIVFRESGVAKDGLSINVERGIVVLRGEVPDDDARHELIAAVEKIDGVWSVRDLLHLPGQVASAEPVGAGSLS